MKKNKILSISVAAYNLEKMIKQNLDSFVNSSVNELIEVIVTDDGSNDGTPEIVKEYEDKYPGTIVLVQQKNSGPGSTVNSGIKHASGKYFKMIDGDDWVDTNNLNTIVKELENIDVDMIITDYQVYDDFKNQIVDTISLDLPANQVVHFNDVCSNLHLDMHNVMFKTSILKDNSIKLDNGFYTDIEYLLLPSIYVKTALYLDLNFYIYRIAQAGQSVSIPSMQRNIAMHDLVLNRLIDFYECNRNHADNNINNYIENRLALMANTQLGTLLTFPNNSENKHNIIDFFQSLKNKSSSIYKKFIKSKRAKILLNSNYLLYGVISKLYVRKVTK